MIWAAGHGDTLFRIDPATYRVQQIKAATMLTGTLSLDTAGRLWVGTTNGIVRIDTPLTPPAELPKPIALEQQQINAFTRDQSGRMLVLTDRVLFQQATGEDMFVPRVDLVDLGIGPGRQMAVSSGNEVWISGTHGGVRQIVLNNDASPLVSELRYPAIASDTITVIFRDSRSWMWVGSDQGLEVFDNDRWRHFDAASGMASNALSPGGITEGEDGALWFATANGISRLEQPEAMRTLKEMKTVITQLRYNSANILNPQQGMSGVGGGQLCLHFEAPTFTSEEALTYRFKLDGVDADFREVKGNAIVYSKVPSQSLHFTGQAIDNLNHRFFAPAALTLNFGSSWLAENTKIFLVPGFLFPFFLAAFIFGRRYLKSRHDILERRVNERTRIMEEVQGELIRRAQIDSLTGLLNRTAVFEEFHYLLGSLSPADLMGAALIDIDHFKAVNDSHGHLVGDAVLREYGSRLKHCANVETIAGRYGGEELILLLPHIRSAEELNKELEAIHTQLRAPLTGIQAEPMVVTCCIGGALIEAGDTATTLLGRADRALYKAKRAGRDQVVMAD